MHLALEVDGDGAHPASWRRSGRAPSEVLRPSAVRDVVKAAETAGFTLVSFADSPLPPSAGLDAVGRLEAVGRAAFVSTLTNRIGLAPTAHVTTTEPFHLATQLASLDFASRGRAAWVVGAVNNAEAMATVGAVPLELPDGLRIEVSEVVEVARQLWDSWEDGAAIRDIPTGRFLDPDLVHHVGFDGTSFSVMGPLITPRPPQGQVVVIAPDELGIAELADVVLVEGAELATIIDRTVKARRSGAALLFAEIEVVLDAGELANDRLGQLDEATPWELSGRYRHVGPAEDLANLLGGLNEHVDGVRLHPAVVAVDLPVLTARVLPMLERVGLCRPPQAGATLRSTLGLSRPANRYADTNV